MTKRSADAKVARHMQTLAADANAGATPKYQFLLTLVRKHWPKRAKGEEPEAFAVRLRAELLASGELKEGGS